MRFTCPFVLASGSPRRRDLLARQGVAFAVDVSDVLETHYEDESAEALVARLALAKARDVSPRHAGALVLGADTIVLRDDTILGKPRSPENAAEMLASLSDREHAVWTGLALVHTASGREFTASERTEVRFAPMSGAEIRNYVASGSPMDKAGAYGIQDDAGAFFIKGIRGDYYNVVGLPLHRLYRLINTHFFDLLAP